MRRSKCQKQTPDDIDYIEHLRMFCLYCDCFHNCGYIHISPSPPRPDQVAPPDVRNFNSRLRRQDDKPTGYRPFFSKDAVWYKPWTWFSYS